jgi:hypothetical protein
VTFNQIETNFLEIGSICFYFSTVLELVSLVGIAADRIGLQAVLGGDQIFHWY